MTTVFSKIFSNGGMVNLVVHGNIFRMSVDVIANSVGPKKSLNDDVLTAGSLAPQFAQRCGQELVDDLSSSKRDCWETGVLQITPSYDMDRGEGSPCKVIHFCLPIGWNDSNTYQILRSLFERAINITHDMGLRSIAFPFIGTGILQYPPLEVMKALLDASSLFREKDSPLKTVYIVVWEEDDEAEQLLRGSLSALRSFEPMGNGYRQMITHVTDFSEVEQAFRGSMGNDRQITSVQVLPIPTSPHLEQYRQKLAKLSRHNYGNVERHLWHGTNGKSANSIVKERFNIGMAGSVCGAVYGNGAYFARDADYSHTYAVPGQRNIHTMLLCKVIIGISCKGVTGMMQPKTGCHSAVDDLSDPRKFVIFDPDQILPLNIIEYTVA